MRGFSAGKMVAAFILNLAIATIATGILETPIIGLAHFEAKGLAPIFRGDLIDGIVAFGLGLTVYRSWRSVTARWVWVAGALWFASRLIIVLEGKHGTFWEFAGSASYSDDESLANWTEVTLPALRAVFYSLGALCGRELWKFGTAQEAPENRSQPDYQ